MMGCLLFHNVETGGCYGAVEICLRASSPMWCPIKTAIKCGLHFDERLNPAAPAKAIGCE